MTKSFFTVLLLLVSLPLQATTDYPRANPVPGGIAIVNLPDAFDSHSHVYFNKKRVLQRKTAKGWQALVGLPLTIKPGTKYLHVVFSTGQKKNIRFKVNNKNYATRHITIKNTRMVSPRKKDIERHYREKPLIVAALKTWTNTTEVETAFIIPVAGRFSSMFGLRRIYNNQKRIRRHTGLDIAAPVGTPIKAPAKGTIIRTGNYFFTGNTVFIDHGQGLISMYSHMNKILVKAGDKVQQGQPIGHVGMTGRVSGPHLHWVISLNNTKVDPKLFIPANDKP